MLTDFNVRSAPVLENTIKRYREREPCRVSLNHAQFSDDSERLPNHRHGVKDYFPNYALALLGALKRVSPSAFVQGDVEDAVIDGSFSLLRVIRELRKARNRPAG